LNGKKSIAYQVDRLFKKMTPFIQEPYCKWQLFALPLASVCLWQNVKDCHKKIRHI
jgi:hypothetical protein